MRLFQQLKELLRECSTGNINIYSFKGIPYAYSNLQQSDRPWETKDVELARTMSSYRANFAKTVDPNSEGLPKWSANQPDAYQIMYLGDPIKLNSIPSKDRLLLLDKILPNV